MPDVAPDLPVETVPLSSLSPHPRNYRDHPDDQLDQIEASIRSSGFYRNIVITRDGTILAGHGVALTAERMGLEEVPVVRLDIDPDSPTAMRVLISDNEIGKGADSDDRMLTELLRDLANDADGLPGTGYTDEQLAALLIVTRHSSEIDTHDAAAEWIGLPDYEPAGPDTVRLIVQFPSDSDREEFVRKNELRIDKKVPMTWSARWPTTELFDTSAVRFVSSDA